MPSLDSSGRVLVVDDVADNVKLLKYELADEGYEVLVAYDGARALTVAELERPDVILIDIMMPEMDGIEACRRLKSNPELEPIPVIMVTAKGHDEDVVRGLDAGAHDYITKPFHFPIVAARVRSALRLKKAFDNERMMTSRLEAQAKLLADYNRRIEAQNQDLHETCIRDPLTNLYNRRHFEEQANGLLRLARRRARPLACMMIDVDRFKKINDSHGHAIGDRVLQSFSGTLRTVVRQSDLVARYGGEEFAVVLPDTDGRGARELAERLRAQVRQLRLSNEGRQIHFSVSVGIAVYPGEGPRTSGQLVQEADTALYEAKRTGRNRVVVA